MEGVPTFAVTQGAGKPPAGVAVGAGVLVGAGVAVGGTGVAVGGTGVAVGGAGVGVGAVSSYTFSAVGANHAIKALFKKKSRLVWW